MKIVDSISKQTKTNVFSLFINSVIYCISTKNPSLKRSCAFRKELFKFLKKIAMKAPDY
jgi:hypothetical protein